MKVTIYTVLFTYWYNLKNCKLKTSHEEIFADKGSITVNCQHRTGVHSDSNMFCEGPIGGKCALQLAHYTESNRTNQF